MNNVKKNYIVKFCVLVAASTLIKGDLFAADNESTTVSITVRDQNGNPIDSGQLPPAVQQLLQQKISTALTGVADGTITPTVTVRDENGNTIDPGQLPPAVQNQISAALGNATNGNNSLGGGVLDPAQMQQRILASIRDQLGFTNDVEWEAVKPLLQKVLAARSETVNSYFGSKSLAGDRAKNNRPSVGGMSGQTNPEREALQKAIVDNASALQIKGLLDICRSSQKAKQARLESAETDLKAVFTTKQEAVAYLLGLVN